MNDDTTQDPSTTTTSPAPVHTTQPQDSQTENQPGQVDSSPATQPVPATPPAENPAPEDNQTSPKPTTPTETPPAEPPTEQSTPSMYTGLTEMPDKIETQKLVVFEGQQVAAILHDGYEKRNDRNEITHFHCKLDDGTEADVPVELFV